MLIRDRERDQRSQIVEAEKVKYQREQCEALEEVVLVLKRAQRESANGTARERERQREAEWEGDMREMEREKASLR